VLAFLLVGTVVTVLACQVPVFRYALERWQADRYDLVVEASGDLSPAEQQAVDYLTKRATDREMPTNLIVRAPELEKSQPASSPAKMSLHYPGRMRGILTKPIWSGPVTMENARRVIESPARKELMRRILTGESAIWVMVESGDAEKDDAAEKQLAESSSEAAQKLEIPDGVVGRDTTPKPNEYVDPENVLQSDVPLAIGFSLLRVSRGDPEEEIFLQMLLNIEDDLGEYAEEPMSFPVFGRGRFLEPLVGRGVTRDNVFEASMYLCGACSCEVKDQNPGMDLLMSMNWDMAMEGSQVIIEKMLPPLEGASVLAQVDQAGKDGVSETDPDKQAATDEISPSEPRANVDGGEDIEAAKAAKAAEARFDMVVAVATVVVLVLAIGTFFIVRRKQG
jgi:hypothetical protein